MTRIIVNSRICNIFRREILVKLRNIMKEINNLKGMLVAGYLIEKLQRFRLLHAAGQEYMPHHCVPCGV